MATTRTSLFSDSANLGEWLEDTAPRFSIPSISRYSELDGAVGPPVRTNTQPVFQLQAPVERFETSSLHPVMCGSTFLPWIPPNAAEYMPPFGTIFEASRSPELSAQEANPSQVPHLGFFGICNTPGLTPYASDTVTTAASHFGHPSGSHHRHFPHFRPPQDIHLPLPDGDNHNLVPSEYSTGDTDHAIHHGPVNGQPPISGPAFMEMAFEVTHLQPRSSSVPISGQSGDPDYPQMSPDDEDFSDDDSTREDDAILPGDIDDYVYDNHDGTSTCIWPDASNEAGYCGRVSTWPLIKRHIKRMHYHERSFPCEYGNCKYSFFTKFSRDVHHNTHTGNKPFICLSCGKGFGSPSGCSHHRIRVHGYRMKVHKHKGGRARKSVKFLSSNRLRSTRHSFRAYR